MVFSKEVCSTSTTMSSRTLLTHHVRFVCNNHIAGLVRCHSLWMITDDIHTTEICLCGQLLLDLQLQDVVPVLTELAMTLAS